MRMLGPITGHAAKVFFVSSLFSLVARPPTCDIVSAFSTSRLTTRTPRDLKTLLRDNTSSIGAGSKNNYAPWTVASWMNGNQEDGPRIQWNFNAPGKSPFGFDLTAEIWNGRLAQISVVWVACQEWLLGKGVWQALQDKDDISVAALLGFLGLVSALTLRFLLLPAAIPKQARQYQENKSMEPDPDCNRFGLWGYVAAKVLDQQASDSLTLSSTSSLLKGGGYTGLFESRDRCPKGTTYQRRQRWNLNSNGRGPYGMDRNAEVWNGRVAMVSFAWILVQEYITGHGIIDGILKGKPADFGALAAFILGLLSFLGVLDYATIEEEEGLLEALKNMQREKFSPQISVHQREAKVQDYSTPYQPPVTPPEPQIVWNLPARPAQSYAPVQQSFAYVNERTASSDALSSSLPCPEQQLLQQEQFGDIDSSTSVAGFSGPSWPRGRTPGSGYLESLSVVSA